MGVKTKELSILAAVAQQCVETRRPISSLIVMAACNARTGIEQDKVLVHLASLKRQGYVTQEGERWEVTPEGHQAARQHIAQAATPSQEPEPIPAKPPVRPKSRDTLRPRQHTAPKPITRLGPPISAELLNRCAAMHLALLPEVQAAYDRGEEGAAAELAWMIETGRLLLKAGGEA